MTTAPPARPRVTLSYAQTLDGRLATRDGSSQWIGSTASLHYAHALRATHDAIMVGAGTVLADNPRLTVRHVAGRDPLRVVVDSTLRLPLTAAVLADGAAHGTLIAATERASQERIDAVRALGATVVIVPQDASGRVDLAALLATLGARGISTLMVEGGAALITSLLWARLADHVAVCIAPKILGAGIEAVGDLGIAALSAAIRLETMTVEPYPPDVIISGNVVYSDGDGLNHQEMN